MREVASEIEGWIREEQPFALATVVETWGSAPRVAGAKMAVAADGRIAGSVSGGCVETAVIQAARDVLRNGEPRLLHFGVADETAWIVGLACGGSIDVFVEAGDPGHIARLRRLDPGQTASVVTVTAGPPELLGRKLILPADGPAEGDLGALAAAARAAAEGARASGKSARTRIAEAEIFVDVLRPPPTLVVVGGVHIAIALTRIAQALGYQTIVVDPRTAFGNENRFPHADRVIPAWPDAALGQLGLTPSTAVAVLTHDPKLDDPALRAALASPAFYVGALGSRATQAKRRQRLAAAGLSDAQIDRLHAPIGLDLGGRAPEDIALAVMAQILAVRNGRKAESL